MLTPSNIAIIMIGLFLAWRLLHMVTGNRSIPPLEWGIFAVFASLWYYELGAVVSATP
jgi:hypothetical protein